MKPALVQNISYDMCKCSYENVFCTSSFKYRKIIELNMNILVNYICTISKTNIRPDRDLNPAIHLSFKEVIKLILILLLVSWVDPVELIAILVALLWNLINQYRERQLVNLKGSWIFFYEPCIDFDRYVFCMYIMFYFFSRNQIDYVLSFTFYLTACGGYSINTTPLRARALFVFCVCVVNGGFPVGCDHTTLECKPALWTSSSFSYFWQ